jgi:hypothetical protein
MNLRAILGRMRDPVTGTLRLTGAESTGNGKYRVEGVVSAMGLLPTPVSAQIHKPTGRFLDTGTDLPILVDRAEPTRFKVNWDGVPSYDDLAAQRQQRAMDEANRLAQQMASGTAPPQQSPWPATGGLADMIGQVMQNAFSQQNAHVHMNSSFEVIHAGFDPARFEHASAEVVAVNDINLPGGIGTMVPGGIVDLALDVARTDGTRYTAHTRTAFNTPDRRAAVATIGTRLDVLVDPANPATVVISQ